MSELEIQGFTYLPYQKIGVAKSDQDLIGGFSKYGQDWAYNCNGDVLDVNSCKDGSQVCSINFSHHLPNATITCCAESRAQGHKLLLVGLDCGAHSGALCLVSLRKSKILKVIKLTESPTCIEEIKSDGGAYAEASFVSERLKLFFGVVAVGTVGGHTYLIDMALDNIQSLYVESFKSSYSVRVLDRSDLPILHREDAINADEVIAFDLNGLHCTSSSYHYTAANGKVVGVFANDDVAVTAMLYIKSAGLLFVGLNLGCYQIWDLTLMRLIFSSQTIHEDTIISHFAFQEPEDDPRYCCYLWIARCPLSVETATSPTVISLHQLLFEEKENVEGIGHVYKDLNSVCLQFEHQLTSDVYHLADSLSIGSRVICCRTVDGVGVKDSTMMMIAWEAPSQDSQVQPTCHLGIFDLNKWYHQQMPSTIRDAMYGGKDPWCHFFIFYSITDTVQPFSSESFMDLKIQTKSIVHFKPANAASSIPEQFFLPSAVSFGMIGGYIIARSYNEN